MNSSRKLVSHDLTILTAALVAMLASATVRADLLSVTGDVSIIAPPPSLLDGALMDSTTAFVFEEQQGAFYPGFHQLLENNAEFAFLEDYFDESTFPGFLHTQTGLVDNDSDVDLVLPPIGLQMDSFFLHFSPVPIEGEMFVASGTLQFDSEIVGVQVAHYHTAMSQMVSSLFEGEDTIYPELISYYPDDRYLNSAYLELEMGAPPSCQNYNDQFEISADRRSLAFCFSANPSSDQLRILTKTTSVPEPSTLALLSLGLAGRAARSRKKDGCFCSGDTAMIEDSYIRIMGRLPADIIKSGGCKVSALEMPAVLLTHDDIKEAAVISVPDDTWGEAVAAVGSLPDGTSLDIADLKRCCDGKMSAHKVPKEIKVLDALPYNAMGKVTNPELAELL